MKTITFTPESMALVEGEIMMYNPLGTLIASTKEEPESNVKHIDRTLFVKPDVDVEKLAHISVEKYYFQSVPKEVVYKAFLEGYNANKKEFTREEMEEAFNYGTKVHILKEYDTVDVEFERFIKMMRPLSIPKSVICDEEYNIIQVKW